MKRAVTLLFALLACVMAYAQSPLTVSVTGTVNTDCIGQGCYYNGPTILINEVMLSPSQYDGSMVGSSYHTTGGGEWIELYNPHKCDSVDISCYFLGNNAYDNTNMSGDWGGGFALPAGTVVPPQGFCMVRGYRAAAVPDSLLVQNGGNVVEVVIDDRYCLDAGGGRLWFPNAGGWFAFYDANGVPQDAISWCSQSNSCMSCYPCTPVTNECGFSGTLPSYDQIPANRKTYITSLNPQNYLGSSFCRIPDGGNWQSTSGTPTYATCNDVCIDPPVIFCAATAVATPAGGTPPYTYLWSDDSQQITDTAFGLCAGTYFVTVTDADSLTAVGEVTIVDYEPPVSHPDYHQCLSDSSVVLSGYPAGGIYEGAFVDTNNTFFFHDSAAVYPIAYTFTDTNGCHATTHFTITVNTGDTLSLYDTICQFDTYQQHNFNLAADDNMHAGDFEYVQNLQNIYGCDSTVTLHIVVYSKPQPDFVSNPERIMLSDGEPVQFINLTDLSDTYPGETFLWQWDFGDGGSENSAEMEMSHTYETWGEFLVTLTLTGSNGCESMISHSVYVDADLELPNIITPNGDGVNDVFAIKNLNPELDNLLTIYDRWGQKVFEMQNYRTYIKDGILYNPETGFTAEHNSDGVYFYTFHYVGFVRAVEYHSTLTVIR